MFLTLNVLSHGHLVLVVKALNVIFWVVMLCGLVASVSEKRW
jgi:hypothetical protein